MKRAWKGDWDDLRKRKKKKKTHLAIEEKAIKEEKFPVQLSQRSKKFLGETPRGPCKGGTFNLRYGEGKAADKAIIREALSKEEDYPMFGKKDVP